MTSSPSYAVRVPGFCCWADHIRTWDEAKREQVTANRTTGRRHSIYIVTAGGVAKEVSR
jgi:hypothetical protein